MLDTLPIALTMESYDPFSDKTGSISEISGLQSWVHNRIDALCDSVNTAASLRKRFAFVPVFI